VPRIFQFMGADLSKLPPIYVSPSRELSNVAMVAARDAGLNVEQRGIALFESAEPPLVLNYDLTPSLAYLAGLAGALTPKIIDGAIAEIGAEMLRCFARMVRAAVKASPRKPSVTVRFETDDGRRAYHLPAIDLDAAAEAILADVGLATEHPVVCERFWDEGRWVGGNDWHVPQGRRPRFPQGGVRLPRAESSPLSRRSARSSKQRPHSARADPVWACQFLRIGQSKSWSRLSRYSESTLPKSLRRSGYEKSRFARGIGRARLRRGWVRAFSGVLLER
jgi:hypothetical protein